MLTKDAFSAWLFGTIFITCTYGEEKFEAKMISTSVLLFINYFKERTKDVYNQGYNKPYLFYLFCVT